MIWFWQVRPKEILTSRYLSVFMISILKLWAARPSSHGHTTPRPAYSFFLNIC